MHKCILNICGNTLLFGLLLSGCASKDVARKAYSQGDYNTSYRIWKRWVDVGYLDKNIDLITILNKSGKSVDYKEIKKMAKLAYNNGEVQSAFVLEDIYLREENMPQAYFWMTKGNLQLSSQHDFQNHLYLIQNYIQSFAQQKHYLLLFEKMAKNNNSDAAYTLAQFYADATNPFYDVRRSKFFYKKAYELGNEDAGIALAQLYISHFKREKEGLDILKKLAQNGNGKAAYKVGDILFQKMNQKLQKQNTPCITTSFKTPEEFYIKKILLQKSREIYLKEGVIPWYREAYSLGYQDALYKLIALDIAQRNFQKDKNFSQMNVNEIENFLLKNRANDKANMLLAKLYTLYPELGKSDEVESLYIATMDKNITQAQWNLYNFYKQQNTHTTQAEAYLQELVREDFKPAIAIMAAQKIRASQSVAENKNILLNQANSGNKEALNQLIALYRAGVIKNIDFPFYLQKICAIAPNNNALDMAMADYYIGTNQIEKGATILQYYAELGNSKAEYKLSKLFQKFCNSQKSAYWLQKASLNGNREAEIDYDIMVLNGSIQGDNKEALLHLQHYAKAGNTNAIRSLAHFYANGIGVDFNPKSAKGYYLHLIQNGEKRYYLNIIALYEKINYNHRYDNEIEALYEIAIKNNVAHSKVKFASYLIKREQIARAKALLMSLSLSQEPMARVLLAKITGKESYIRSGKGSNNGLLLLRYAQLEAKYSKRKALLYALRAHLCNTPSSGKLTTDLMRLINNSQVIFSLYQKAKSYPKCSN